MSWECKEHGELKCQWGFCPYCGKPSTQVRKDALHENTGAKKDE
jgi:hypothetical protein